MKLRNGQKLRVVWFGMWQEAHMSKYKINIMRNYFDNIKVFIYSKS